jgi:hypothetical protein
MAAPRGRQTEFTSSSQVHRPHGRGRRADKPMSVGMPREIALAGFPVRHRERMRNVHEVRESLETVLMGELFTVVHGVTVRPPSFARLGRIFRATNCGRIQGARTA